MRERFNMIRERKSREPRTLPATGIEMRFFASTAGALPRHKGAQQLSRQLDRLLSGSFTRWQSRQTAVERGEERAYRFTRRRSTCRPARCLSRQALDVIRAPDSGTFVEVGLQEAFAMWGPRGAASRAAKHALISSIAVAETSPRTRRQRSIRTSPIAPPAATRTQPMRSSRCFSRSASPVRARPPLRRQRGRSPRARREGRDPVERVSRRANLREDAL